MKIGGTAYIKTDGKQWTLGASMSVKINSVTRTGVRGLSGGGGYTEEHTVSYIEGEFLNVKDFSAVELADIVDATVVAELVNGKSYMLSHAWLANDVVSDAAAGTIPFRFESLEGKELL